MSGLLDRLAADPRSFTWLRKIAEANFTAVRREVRRRLAVPPGGLVLDLGCGTGELAPLFEASAYLGLDISPAYVAYARRRFPAHRFAVADGAVLPLRDGSCDAVLVFGVLHHLEDPLARRVAAEAARVLPRPGGRFLLIEDRADVPAWNLAGRLMHALDAGDSIRARDGYDRLLPRESLVEVERFTFRSGVCDYYGFVLERR